MPNRRFLLLLAALVIPACGPGDAGRSIAPSGPPGPTTLQVFPKGWTGARLLEIQAGRALNPDIAFSTNGVGFAAWSQQWQDVAGARLDIWASRYVPGTGWEAPQLIEHEDLGHAFIPKIAVDPLGNATVVWSQSDVGNTTTHLNAWTARYEAGFGWRPAQLLENSAETVGGPVVAGDPSGNAVAVWMQYDTAVFKSNVWASRYTMGGTWSAPEQIENEPGNADNCAVGMDASGNAIAVFTSHDGTRMNLWANRYVAGTGWTGEQLIEQTNNSVEWLGQLAVSANGMATVLWTTGGGPYATRYEPGVGWLAPETVQNIAPSNSFDRDLAADASGGAVAVWVQKNNLTSRYDLWANRFVPGSGWEAAVLIEPATPSGSPYGPAIAVSPAGDALVVWGESDGFVGNAWATRYVVGIGWDAARQIESKDLGAVDKLRVAVDGQGRGAAVWNQIDGPAYDIWANRYE